MNFKMTKIAALAAMAFASTGAHAALTGSNTLSIMTDDVTFQTASGAWTRTVNPGVDSFFTMGGSKLQQLIDGQFALLYNGANLTLSGATQSAMDTFTYYGAPGSNETIGTGISILSASGDTAKVNMTGWKVDWGTVQDIPMGTGAWGNYVAGDPYDNGVGEVLCATGSGCALGSAYTLKYTATVPVGDASGFGTVKYYLELHGTVGAVPEASTYGMMLAGLGLVGFAVRRRKSVI